MQGPNLVRSASITRNVLQLTGDYSNITDFEVYAPKAVTHITFNGESTKVSRTSYGSLVGKLGACSETTASIEAKLPALNNWKSNDGLPERLADYDDSKWTVANHSSTPNPSPPATYPVLYADEYGKFQSPTPR